MSDKRKIVHEFEFIGRIIGILKILKDETDECTALKQSEILELMKDNDYKCSERTLTDYLKGIMKELNPEDANGFVEETATISDYKIIVDGLEEKLHARDLGLKKEGSKKLQLRNIRYNQLFSFEELNQVIEAVLFLKNINEETKEKLIRKLQKLSSENYPKYSPFISETTGKISNNISSVFEDSRIDEVAVRNNLEIIQKAIEADGKRGRMISFHFNGYNEEKKLNPRKNAAGELIKYVVSPYYVILYNGKYYLICCAEPYDNVSFYRVDLMSDISEEVNTQDEMILTIKQRKAKRDVKGLPREWNDKAASEFQSEHLYMYYGEPCNIKLKIDRDRYTLLHDYFGNRYRFKKHIDDKWDEVEVKCVPKAMEAWAMQCGDYVEVIEPVELRESIANKCKEMYERYNKKNNEE